MLSTFSVSFDDLSISAVTFRIFFCSTYFHIICHIRCHKCFRSKQLRSPLLRDCTAPDSPCKYIANHGSLPPSKSSCSTTQPHAADCPAKTLKEPTKARNVFFICTRTSVHHHASSDFQYLCPCSIFLLFFFSTEKHNPVCNKNSFVLTLTSSFSCSWMPFQPLHQYKQ